MISRVLSASLLASTALLFACAAPATDDQAAAGEETAAQATEATDPCAAANLAAGALASGTKILVGVTLETSTPIADILAKPDDFAGRNVRIEGVIVEICQSQGCYVTLQDPSGNKLNLKVVDGELDFRELVKTGQYAVGEGVFSKEGEHGAQLDIMKAGAMVGTTVCPITL
jgi:hypothetical protein